LGLLSQTPQVNLYSHLIVLCNLKYKEPSDQDDAFFAAKSGADMSLLMLRQLADDGKTEAEGIITALLKVRQKVYQHSDFLLVLD